MVAACSCDGVDDRLMLPDGLDRQRLPHLQFVEVESDQGEPEAVFDDPAMKCRYFLTADQVRTGQRQGQEMGYEMPHFQLAGHHLRYAQRQQMTDKISHRAAKLARWSASRAVGAAVAFAVLVRGVAILQDQGVDDAYASTNPETSVGNTTYKVDLRGKTVATGTTAKGAYWQFDRDGTLYCTVSPPDGAQHGPVWNMAGFRYGLSCIRTGIAPHNHPARTGEAAALTAYWQVAAKGELAPALDDVTRAVAGYHRYQKLMPK